MRLCFASLLLLPLAAGFASAAPAAPAEQPAAAAAASALPAAMQRDAHCRQFIATCLVEGRPARLMVDTGATHTVLAADFVAQQLPGMRFIEGAELRGNAAQQPRLGLASLRAGEVELGQGPVLVMGLEGVNSMLGQRVDGILGMSHLGLLPFTLDLREGARGHWGLPPQELPLLPLVGRRDAAGRLFLDARCGPAACPLLLDTGSTVTTWPLGQWPEGRGEAQSVRVGDVNGAHSAQLAYGRPATLQVGGAVALPQVGPQLRPGAQGHVLGLDALEGGVLVHRPGRGFYLMPPKNGNKRADFRNELRIKN